MLRLASSSALAFGVLLGCGSDSSVDEFPREVCGHTAVQGAPAKSKYSAPSLTVATSDGDRLYWVEDHYNFERAPQGVIHSGARDGGDDRVIATDTIVPQQIVVDDENVYWSAGSAPGRRGSAIKAVAKSGGTPWIVAITEPVPPSKPSHCGGAIFCPYRIAVDDKYLYDTNNRLLRRSLKREVERDTTLIAEGRIASVAVDATDVYWLECGEPRLKEPPTPAVVWKLPKVGGPAIRLATQENNGCMEGRDVLALDETTVYFALGTYIGAIHAVPKAGGAVRLVSEATPAPSAIAVGTTEVFWMTGGVGSPSSYHGLVSVPKAGGTRVDLTPQRKDHDGWNDTTCDPLHVLADRERVYWVTSGALLRESRPR